jgi:pimeloyl-ACP methyl ester carboxylesterase
MHSGSPRTLSFSGYVLDLQRCALMHGDQEIQLRPKSFDVLRYLAEHAGRLVSKEELIKASWPDTFVTDDSLVQCIKDIREALADGDHQIIKTVPRRGYLFAAELSVSNGDTMVVATAARAPEITFCRTKDGINLAVGCLGQGMPLVRTSHWMTNVEYEWQNPLRAPLLHFLAARFRLIRYDSRGNGLSDWDVADVSFNALQHDLETVVDALGLRSYALLGMSQGAALAIAHAIRYPGRVSKIVLLGAYALGYAKRPSRKGFDMTAFLTLMREGWGDEHSAFQKMLSTVFLPDASAEQIGWLAELQRKAASPENAVRLRRTFDDIDVVDLLPKVSAPTLVLHCRHDNLVPYEEGRRIAKSIPNAKFVTLESENHIPRSFEPAWPIFLGEIETFLLEE